MRQKSAAKIVTQVLAGIYILGVIVTTPYYAWFFNHQNSFAKSYLLGDAYATFKGFLWPYFVFLGDHEARSNSGSKKFTSLKTALLPKIEKACVNDATWIEPGREMPERVTKYCACYAQASVDAMVTEDDFNQEKGNQPSPDYSVRVWRIARQNCKELSAAYVMPQIEQTCKSKIHDAINGAGKPPKSIDQYCKCYSRVAFAVSATATEAEMLQQAKTGAMSSEAESRFKAALDRDCPPASANREALSTIPRATWDLIQKMEDAAALLDICFGSQQYKSLPDEKALRLHGLLIRLDSAVEKIGKQYKVDDLVGTFTLYHVKESGLDDLKATAKTKYGYCGDKLFDEMSPWISQVEKGLH